MKFSCPYCQTQVECCDSFVGSSINCPTCGKPLVIQTPLPPKAAPTFRVVFEPISSGPSSTVSNSGDKPRPTGRQSKLLSLKMPLVCLGISVASLQMLEFIHSEPLLFLTLIALILFVVSQATLHYKCWKAIPVEFARLKPGKSVGYLFIPFFNLYWRFPSISGLGIACTRLARSKGVKGFGRLVFWGLALAILWCLFDFLLFLDTVGWFSPPWCILVEVGAFIAWFFFYRGVTALLNRLAETT